MDCCERILEERLLGRAEGTLFQTDHFKDFQPVWKLCSPILFFFFFFLKVTLFPMLWIYTFFCDFSFTSRDTQTTGGKITTIYRAHIRPVALLGVLGVTEKRRLTSYHSYHLKPIQQLVLYSTAQHLWLISHQTHRCTVTVYAMYCKAAGKSLIKSRNTHQGGMG